ncbi:MAG: hypothetical protein Q7J40_03820 [Atribacterota bacterium]|nr:hypothetical protein [Atribacterota bacterium]
MPGEEKEHSLRQEDKNIHLSRTMPSVDSSLATEEYFLLFTGRLKTSSR